MLGAAVGWYRFWCTPIDAPYTKLIGASLLMVSSASFLGLAIGPANPGAAAGAFDAGGWVGAQFAGALMASFNRTGSLIITFSVERLCVSAMGATECPEQPLIVPPRPTRASSSARRCGPLRP